MLQVNKIHSLVGKYFHSFDKGLVKWQGTVLCLVGKEFCLVQLFEWITGAPSVQKLVHFCDMENWDLYETVEEMNEEYRLKWGPLAERSAK